jgi:hypothetical protein
MRMCMDHWNRLREELEDHGLLFANTLMMQKLLNRMGGDVYRAQEEIGDGCPICWLKEDGFFESLVEETKKALGERTAGA